MRKTIIRTHDNNFFRVDPDNAQGIRIQYLANDLEVAQVKYFIYLKDNTEDFKKGKALYFDKLNECYLHYIAKSRENQYIYIDYGFEVNNGAYIIEKRIDEGRK